LLLVGAGAAVVGVITPWVSMVSSGLTSGVGSSTVVSTIVTAVVVISVLDLVNKFCIQSFFRFLDLGFHEILDGPPSVVEADSKG